MSAGPVQPRHSVRVAAQVLAADKVIAYPTEAVWGLGCDPFNRRAVMRLLALKQRPVDKGLILVAASIEQFEPYLEGLSAQQRQTLAASWPSATTWLVPHNGYAPDWIRGRFDSVALRVSTHPVVASLCQTFAAPIVSSSANPAGMPPYRWPWQIRKQWGSRVDWIVPGPLGGAQRPSEIKDLLTQDIVRPA